MRGDVGFFVIARLIYDFNPVFAIGGGMDLVLVNRIIFFPMDTQGTHIGLFFKLHLPGLANSLPLSAPACTEISIDRVLREILFVSFF